MSKEKIEALVEGGKASAAPPLGPALGPLQVNIGEVVAEINKKTAAFNGMKVPVKVIVDTDTKEFKIEVGTPPISQLIKKELGIELGSGAAHENKVGNMAIEQVVKVAKMKVDSMIVNDLKSAVKSVVGTCQSMGILIESKVAKDVEKEVDEGKYDDIIKNETTEVSAEKAASLKEKLDVEQVAYAEVSAKRKVEKEVAADIAEKKAASAEKEAELSKEKGPVKKEEKRS